MVTNYPATIDNTQNLTIVRDNATSIKASLLNDLRGAIVAIETELGVKPSGVYSTVRARLEAMESSFIRTAGDIGGTAALPLVIGMQGRPISSLPPGVGDALIWSGAEWIPHAVATSGGGSDVTFSGDLSGSDIVQAVIGLRGRPLANTAPTTGQNLAWNGSAWAPSSTVNITFAGDLSGSASTQTVIRLQSRSVSSSAPSTNDVLGWNGSTWTPTALTAGGDLSGSLGSANVIKLQGRAVSTSSPAVGQALVWGGSSWAPSSSSNTITDTIVSISNADYSVVTANLNTIVFMSGLSANRTVTLPASPSTGQKVAIKDTDGSLATRNIIVAGNGHNIDNASSFTISNIQGPYSSLSVQYNGSTWSII